MNMKNIIPKKLIGKTIQLEPLTMDHFDALRLAADDERIWAYMPAKANGEFFSEWFQDCLDKHREGSQITYIIRCLANDRIVGSRAYYEIDFTHKRLEVGYGWVTPKFWGSRINHECLLLLFQNAFEEWKFNRIQIETDPRNTRNYNNLKKLGATQEGFLRQHMIHHNGLVTDTVLFSILSAEWPKVKNILANRLS
jgi:RimJ/RimL family protein N-acetyltransferase